MCTRVQETREALYFNGYRVYTLIFGNVYKTRLMCTERIQTIKNSIYKIENHEFICTHCTRCTRCIHCTRCILSILLIYTQELSCFSFSRLRDPLQKITTGGFYPRRAPLWPDLPGTWSRRRTSWAGSPLSLSL